MGRLGFSFGIGLVVSSCFEGCVFGVSGGVPPKSYMKANIVGLLSSRR